MNPSTILIVDDEPANLMVLSQLLRPMYRVLASKTGELALQSALMNPRPDLILLDVMMPEINGYTVLSRLQADENTRDIPVIFVTALDDSMDEEKGLELGAVDYITKPIKPAIVKARVKAHLEIKQSRDRLKDQNAWLEAEVSRRMRENILVQDISLCALAGLAEARDSDTGNHIMRTQAYVDALARQLQLNPRVFHELDEATLTRIIKAAPLHDIGKVGIPDHILLKPGKLTPEEFEIMKGHCAIGGRAISGAINRVRGTNSKLEVPPESLAFLEVARDIAVSHHEKWDGTGYPEGLSGALIPLPARLMAVADVYDALVTPRVYKDPWRVDDAVRFILDQKGKHFDPDIVDAFSTVRKTFETIGRKLSDPEPGESS